MIASRWSLILSFLSFHPRSKITYRSGPYLRHDVLPIDRHFVYIVTPILKSVPYHIDPLGLVVPCHLSHVAFVLRLDLLIGNIVEIVFGFHDQIFGERISVAG